jgi:hypothetical protein
VNARFPGRGRGRQRRDVAADRRRPAARARRAAPDRIPAASSGR